MKKLKERFTLSQAKGFTLIEVVVVMAIIAVLALLVIGAITVARNTAKETTHKSNAKTLQVGLEAYYAKNKSYPTTSGSFNGTATIVSVTLAGSDTDECGSGTVARGGTYAWNSTDAKYTITPYDAACKAAMTGTDVITGP